MSIQPAVEVAEVGRLLPAIHEPSRTTKFQTFCAAWQGVVWWKNIHVNPARAFRKVLGKV
jgi:hypothetical protein